MLWNFPIKPEGRRRRHRRLPLPLLSRSYSVIPPHLRPGPPPFVQFMVLLHHFQHLLPLYTLRPRWATRSILLLFIRPNQCHWIKGCPLCCMIERNYRIWNGPESDWLRVFSHQNCRWAGLAFQDRFVIFDLLSLLRMRLEYRPHFGLILLLSLLPGKYRADQNLQAGHLPQDSNLHYL